MQLHYEGGGYRHPLWNKSRFVEELRRLRSIRTVCNFYANEQTGWRGYYGDVWRWRKAQPEFDNLVKSLVKKKGAGGRPKKQDDGWKERYIEEYKRTRGDYGAAAVAAGYSVRQIREYTDPFSSTFDEEFTRELRAIEEEMAGIVQSKFMSLTDDRNFVNEDGEPDLNAAKVAQTKGWVYLKALERMDPERWGRKSRVTLEGKVEHRHNHLLPESTQKLLATIVEEKKKLDQARLEARREQMALLRSGNEEDMIDAEVVEEDARAE